MRWYRVVGLILLCGLFAFAAAIISGGVAFMHTQGNSMAPHFATGDLALVRSAPSYQVGDIAAYRSDLLKQPVLHRVVAAENGRYKFKGDSNSWADPETRTGADVIGKLAVRIPQGGLWVNRLGQPLGLVLVALGLMGAIGSATRTRHRQRRATMSTHARSARRNPAVSALPPHLRGAATLAAAGAALALALGALAWSGPVAQMAAGEDTANRQMSFSYSAQVAKSAAYDGTTVSSPQPVFRKLAKTLDVRYSYRGEPGTVAVDAELSTSSGWRMTVPLAARSPFSAPRHDGRVRLDLVALEKRAQAAARVTGMPLDQLTITVAPKVITSATKPFNPTFELLLTPLHVAAVNQAATTVKDSTVVKKRTLTPRSLSLFDREMSVVTARTASIVLLGISLLAGALIVLLGAATRRRGEAAGIRRSYAPLLLRVHPMPAASGQPIIDVTDFAALAKLADRYGLFVMHWLRSDVETFVVQDTSATYRYRTTATPEEPAPEGKRIDVRIPSDQASAPAPLRPDGRDGT